MKALEVYRYFLRGIKRENTSVVSPSSFNEIIWRAQLKWLRAKAPANDLEQQIMDDLQPLRCITDNTQTWNNVTLDYVKPISTNIFDLPVSGEPYPKYYRMQSMQVYTSPIEANTEPTANEVGPRYARVLKADRKAVMNRNHYRKPSSERLYYEIVSDKIRIITEGVFATKLILEYLRLPKPIFFDEMNPTEGNNINHIPGQGSVGSELGENQTLEIIDIAVALYLEENRDPRVQTFQRN